MNKPDLARYGCTRLEIDIPADMPTAEASRIFGASFIPSRSWSFFAYQEYAGQDKKHSCTLLAHYRTRRPGKERANLHLHLSFRIGADFDMRSIKGKLQPALDFVASHPELIKGRRADIAARFSYSDRAYDPFPNLPITYPLAGFEQCEMVGLRLTVREKLSSERPQFTIVVEKTADRNVHHHVAFSFKAADVEGFFPSVLSVAKAISSKFVREKSGGQQ